jgi:hypothetical protein
LELRAVFELVAAPHSKFVLEKLLEYFKIGSIQKSGSNFVYRVTKRNDLINVIIPHFQKYSLISHKSVTFILWCKAVELLNKGASQSNPTLLEILSIYAALGRGPSSTIMKNYPTLTPCLLPNYVFNSENLNGWWITGYFTLHCDFDLEVEVAGWKNNVYHKMQAKLGFSRNIIEEK